MDDNNENLWICPLCSAEHVAPVIVCHRCECQILLLVKIKLTAYALKQTGYQELGLRFYNTEKLD